MIVSLRGYLRGGILGDDAHGCSDGEVGSEGCVVGWGLLQWSRAWNWVFW